jgi:hypothetical protein
MDPTTPAPDGQDPRDASGGSERTAEIIAGDFLLTLNPVDGSQIESCPPGRQPISGRSFPDPSERTAEGGLQLLERDEERERLARLLARGRSVRLSGAPGTGRTALLTALAQDCAELAPDGLIRLSGYRRTVGDLTYELHAAAYHTPGHRPGRAELRAALREIGAVVLVDDIEFGGAALHELLDATPECAFLVSSVTGTPAADSRLEEVVLSGLSRTACLELLELGTGRPLTDAESDWAADLWFATEGLPLSFVQAAALLRWRDSGRFGGPLPAAAELMPALIAGLTEGAREALRLAAALGGTMPAAFQLPALTGDHDALAGHAELGATGLITASGVSRRLAPGVAVALAAAEPAAESAAARSLTAAQHYTWWLADARPTAPETADEAEVLLAVTQSAQRAGHDAAVTTLARLAAPRLAAALRWGAWERVLRTGQESSRGAGFVADQAYFHHELGILAICLDQLDRARAELEASIGLRGVLADSGGVHAGRRALALVEDLTMPAPPSALAAPMHPPPSGISSAFAVPEPPGSEDLTETLDAVSSDEPADGPQYGIRSVALSGTRRNAVAAGAGALLVAVLGTVVTLGLASGSSDNPPESPRPTRTGPATSSDTGSSEPTDSSTSSPSPDPSEGEDGEDEEPEETPEATAGSGTAGGGADTGGQHSTPPPDPSGGSDTSGSSSGGTETSGGATSGGSSSGGSASGGSASGSNGGAGNGGSGNGGSGSTGTTDPSDPDPTDPDPTDPDPTDPDPADPTDPTDPADPDPSDPTDPDPTDDPTDPTDGDGGLPPTETPTSDVTEPA